jgi:hypothetical protein
MEVTVLTKAPLPDLPLLSRAPLQASENASYGQCRRVWKSNALMHRFTSKIFAPTAQMSRTDYNKHKPLRHA